MVERRGRDVQRTCMNDPWTWTTVWGLTEGVGVGWVEESKGGKSRITVKNFFLIKRKKISFRFRRKHFKIFSK